MTSIAISRVRFALRRSRRRAFTFIELVVAIALSVILLRGMYTIFDAATTLTRASDERTGQLLEASAIFDYIAGDLARAPFSGDRLFKAEAGGTLVFRASSTSPGSADVFIRYEFVSGTPYGEVRRGVYVEAGCSTGVDEDGDGRNDTGMVIGRKVKSLDVFYHSSGDINGTWPTGTTDQTRAVKFIMTLGSMTPGAAIKDEEFTVIIPVMSL